MGSKKILSACMVVFVVFISMVVLSGVAAGRAIENGDHVIIGERNLSFVDALGTPIGNGTIEATWGDEPIIIFFRGPFNSYYWEDILEEGDYKVNSSDTDFSMTVYFHDPKLDIKIKVNVWGKGYEITKVLKGSNVTFGAFTNLDIIEIENVTNTITYELVDPRGRMIRIENRPLVRGIEDEHLTINTAQMEEGDYKLRMKTDPETNNGLDKKGPSESFTIEKKITITPDVKKQAIEEDINFNVSTTSPRANVSLNVTRGVAANVMFVEFIYKNEAIIESEIGHRIPGDRRTDENGNLDVTAYFTEPGTYEITATYIRADKAFISGLNITASATVEIVDFSAEVSTNKTRYYAGEHVNITGSANAGDNVTVKVDDEEIERDADAEGFSCRWNTSGAQPGSYEIGVWVLPFSKPDSAPPDASVTVFLMRGGLSATVSREVVAPGDSFWIEGGVSGRDRVDILTIGPKGGSGEGLNPKDSILPDAPGITYSNRSLSPEGDFEEEMKVHEDADTGTYLIAVLSYGRDGIWGTEGSSNLSEVLSNSSGSLAVKTQEQIIAIVKDRTINAAGSDDLLSITTITVENPEVRLDDIEEVLLGGTIVVSGYTNREEDYAIIITVEGPVDLKPKLAFVEKDGTFNTSFSTVSAHIGEYTVTAEDGEGHTDTKTVRVITAAAPLLSGGGENSRGNLSTPAPAADSGGASAQSEREDARLLSKVRAMAKKQPGFGVTGALIGLAAAVAVWLGVRRRRKG
jgi:hypothetical protein